MSLQQAAQLLIFSEHKLWRCRGKGCLSCTAAAAQCQWMQIVLLTIRPMLGCCVALLQKSINVDMQRMMIWEEPGVSTYSASLFYTRHGEDSGHGLGGGGTVGGWGLGLQKEKKSDANGGGTGLSRKM